MKPSTIARIALVILALGLVTFMIKWVGLTAFLIGILPTVAICITLVILIVALGAFDQ